MTPSRRTEEAGGNMGAEARRASETALGRSVDTGSISSTVGAEAAAPGNRAVVATVVETENMKARAIHPDLVGQLAG